MAKNYQKIEIFSKKCFWSKSIQNRPKRVINRKYRFWKFSHWKFFSGTKPFFFQKIGDQKIENFPIIFLVGIYLEWSKTCFKTIISILKIFHVKIFFSDIAIFSKNWWRKYGKFFDKVFLIGIDLELSKMYFKTKISILKIFSHWKSFFRDISVFKKDET